MKLKTLKEIIPLHKYKSVMREDRFVVKDLRQEAIKWIKAYRKKKLPPKGNPARTIVVAYNIGVVSGFREFFNIEDEINFKNGNKIVCKKSKEKIRGYK